MEFPIQDCILKLQIPNAMNPLQKALHSAHLIGAGNVFRSIRYAIRRDQLDAKYGPAREPGLPLSTGRLLSAEAIESGAHFTYEAGELTIRFLTNDFIFLSWDGATMAP